jgi:glycosyltransferase involved in cell wall biosynthesis
MRILVITNYYPPIELGGWEQLTSNVVAELINRGHQVQVLTSNYLNEQIANSEPDVNRSLYLESYDPQNYHPNYTLVHRFQEKENIQTLSKLEEKFNPDIIYINGMWNLPHSLAMKAEELIPGRVVYYIASYWPTEQDAHTTYWSTPTDGSWRQGPKNLLASVVTKTLIASTPRNQLDFKLVLCVSAYVQDYVVEEVGVPKERTRVVHNGIELELFRINQARSNDGVLKLLYAGRLSPDKGVHTILESLVILRKGDPHLPVKLSIYGSGASDYQNQLERMVADNELGELVQFEGVVPRDEMPVVFAAHHVLLFPSIWSEPLARIIQEAMACGLVVIGTSTGGTREILQDGKNGLTFAAGDAQMLANKILQIISDQELRRKFSQAARCTVEEEFSLDRMVDQIEESFTHLLGQMEHSLE